MVQPGYKTQHLTSLRPPQNPPRASPFIQKSLSPTHRQSPASIIRLPGSFVLSSAPHSSKFSRCGHSTQTGTPHPSATQGCRRFHQFFIIHPLCKQSGCGSHFVKQKLLPADRTRPFIRAVGLHTRHFLLLSIHSTG